MFPLRMVIFHCYVSSPEGKSNSLNAKFIRGRWMAWRENEETHVVSASTPELQGILFCSTALRALVMVPTAN